MEIRPESHSSLLLQKVPKLSGPDYHGIACLHLKKKKMKSPRGPTFYEPSSVKAGIGKKDQDDDPHPAPCVCVCALGGSWAP